MATKKCKVEVHRLTLSGLADGTPYGGFLHTVREQCPDLAHCEWRQSDKTHTLKSTSIRNRRLRLLFYTYKGGIRPEVIDTQTHEIRDNPFSETQAELTYTHALGGQIEERYLLLVESTQGGLSPRQMEGYLQWMTDTFHQTEEGKDSASVTVSVEPDPSEEFIERMNSLDRITKATVRTVRPNPGWRDLETELAKESHVSDAYKTEVTMSARRNQSLSNTSGIVQAIRELFSQNKLNFARIEGKRGDESDSFSTENLNAYRYVSMDVDDNGEVRDKSAWETLSQMMDALHKEEQASNR